MLIASMVFENPEQTEVGVQVEGKYIILPWRPSTWHRELLEEWLADGNAIQPFVVPPERVPDASPLQLFDELDQAHGIDLEAEIGLLNQKALRRFRLSGIIRRTDQFAAGLQAKLGWTDEQVDALFRAAAAR